MGFSPNKIKIFDINDNPYTISRTISAENMMILAIAENRPILPILLKILPTIFQVNICLIVLILMNY